MTAIFSDEGKLDDSVKRLIQERDLRFCPAIYRLNDQSRQQLSGLPLDRLPDGEIYDISIRSPQRGYGTIYYAVKDKSLVEVDGADESVRYPVESRLSDLPEEVLLAVREAIQQQPHHCHSPKARELFLAEKGG